jgi:poly-gamma-glutamate synthesis protein (capsule biosynthesis protein)
MFDVDNKTTGYADTIEYWATKDVLQVGGYKNEEDYNNIRVLEIQGIKIAFLAYTYDPYSSNRTSMNKKSKEAGYVLPLINDDVITRHISLAKQKAELVFVSVHWGT